ncbi:hypothetical protein ACFLRZ_04105 [Bacteroidota bacterium]
MNTKSNILKLIFFSLILGFIAIFFLYQFHFQSSGIKVKVEVLIKDNDVFQILWDSGNGFNMNESQQISVAGSNAWQEVVFEIPDFTNILKLRLYPGTKESDILIKNIEIAGEKRSFRWNSQDILIEFEPIDYISDYKIIDSSLLIRRNGTNPCLQTNKDINSIIFNITHDYSINVLIIIWLIVILLTYILNVFINPGITVKNAKYIKILSISVFCIFLFLPIVKMTANSVSHLKSPENRFLVQKPKFNIQHLDIYPSEYTAYFDDNFGYRINLVMMNNLFKLKCLNVSPLPKKLVLGKNNWLFLTDEGVDLIARNLITFSPKQLEKIRINLTERQKWLQKRGINYILFFIPLKHTVYPEFLPESLRDATPVSQMDQLISYLKQNTDLRIIDVRSLFFKIKKHHQLYYSNDSHWNHFGAFIAYQALLKEINKIHPSLNARQEDEFTFITQENNLADLAFMMALNNKIFRKEIIMMPSFRYVSEPFYINQYPEYKSNYEIMVFENGNSSNPRMLMFRDSYANSLLSLLSEHFSRSTYLWTNHFYSGIIEKEKPNLVIHEILERFISDLLENNPAEVQQEIDNSLYQ